VFLNLSFNAIDAMDQDGGSITVDIQPPPIPEAGIALRYRTGAPQEQIVVRALITTMRKVGAWVGDLLRYRQETQWTYRVETIPAKDNIYSLAAGETGMISASRRKVPSYPINHHSMWWRWPPRQAAECHQRHPVQFTVCIPAPLAAVQHLDRATAA
jgi:hypothetical protein